MSSFYYNHNFYNFLANKNDRLLAQNSIPRAYITYYKRLQNLTHIMRTALSGLVHSDALNTCHIAHITTHLLVISTPHPTIAAHLKSMSDLILAQLVGFHPDFDTLKSVHISIVEHVEMKSYD